MVNNEGSPLFRNNILPVGEVGFLYQNPYYTEVHCKDFVQCFIQMELAELGPKRELFHLNSLIHYKKFNNINLL